jgi:hypothetical protein
MIQPATDVPIQRRRFPLFDRPIVAIDADDTLCEYDGHYRPDFIGPPRPNAIWALQIFKANGWEVVLHTNRSNHELLQAWIDEFAPGLIDYINTHPKNAELSMNPGKPVADLFIDDRDFFWLGRPVDWQVVIRRLHGARLLCVGKAVNPA